MKTETVEKAPTSNIQAPEKHQTPSTKGQPGEAASNGEMEVKWVLRGEVRPDPEQPRKVFNPEKLEELAESIRAVGIRQPLQVERHAGFEVRPDKDVVNPGWEIVERGTGRVAGVELQEKNARKAAQALGGEKPFYKLVDGERRWRAAELAGMERVPVLVVDGLNEKERLAVQVVLNQQHENLSALEEAGAYAREIASGRHTAETLYKALGISRGKLFGRLALNRLHPPIREALVSGRISVSVAGLVAMVPGEKEQKKLLEEIDEQQRYGETMSVRELQEEIEDKYVRQLAKARFDVNRVYEGPFQDGKEKGELKKRGSCQGCRYRSGNMAAEFPELAKRPNVCTQVSCFEAKGRAAGQEVLKAAAAKGWGIVKPGEQRLFDDYDTEGLVELRSGTGYIDLDAACSPLGWNTKQTWRQALGKEFSGTPTVALDPKGNARELLGENEALAALKRTGKKIERESHNGGTSSAEHKRWLAMQRKKKEMEKVAGRASEVLLQKLVAGRELDGRLWRVVAWNAYHFTSIDNHAFVAKRRGLTKVQTDCREKLEKWLKENEGNATECARLAVDLLVCACWNGGSNYSGGPKWDKEFVALCEAAKVSLEEAGDKTPNSKLQHPEKQQSPSTKKTEKAKEKKAAKTKGKKGK